MLGERRVQNLDNHHLDSKSMNIRCKDFRLAVFFHSGVETSDVEGMTILNLVQSARQRWLGHS